jgi:hypothetical protein
MKIVETKDVPIADTPHKVDVRKIYDTEHAMTVLITLQPGEKLIRHITPVDVFFLRIRRNGTS